MRELVEARHTSRVPDIREAGFEDALPRVVAWFLANFQPADASHAEYFTHWEGPHSAREEILHAFGSAIGDLTLDAAVKRIERAGTAWAPSRARLRGERT